MFVDAGATIVCSKDCIAESLRKNPKAWEQAAADYKGEKLEHPQIGFADKLVFDDGAHRVELIKVGPGHTAGDAVAWLPKERILFTGDLCVNQRPGTMWRDPDADPDGWLRALDALSLYDPVRVVPGHGAIGGKDALAGQRAYLDAMITAYAAVSLAAKPPTSSQAHSTSPATRPGAPMRRATHRRFAPCTPSSSASSL